VATASATAVSSVRSHGRTVIRSSGLGLTSRPMTSAPSPVRRWQIAWPKVPEAPV